MRNIKTEKEATLHDIIWKKRLTMRKGPSMCIDNNHRIPLKNNNKRPNYYWAYHDNFLLF